jgi:hypothetical protein
MGTGTVSAKSEATPVTGRRDLYGSEILKIPHFLENPLKNGGDFVSLTHARAYLYSPENCLFISAVITFVRG